MAAPSWPFAFIPQQNAMAPGVTPHVWKPPTLIVAKLTPPETGTGVDRSLVEPSPSCPKKLFPQQ